MTITSTETMVLTTTDRHVPAGYDPTLYRTRHSCAHILAQAVRDFFAEDSEPHPIPLLGKEREADIGAVHFAIGPPIEHGFYYDFALPRPLTMGDLPAIEERMRAIIRGNHPFTVREVTPAEAVALFAGQPYKLELIAGLTPMATDPTPLSPPFHGGERGWGPDVNPESDLPLLSKERAGVRSPDSDPTPFSQRGTSDSGEGPGMRAPERGEVGSPESITVYTQDTFTDLCRGPHVASTADIRPDAFRLLSVSGAYWRGDENRPALQRIYGTAWQTPEDLQQHLWRLAEADKRDHRRLGKELELFHFDATAPGMPYWLPRGLKVLNELIAFWRREHERRGYQEIATPIFNSKKLWEISGHWDHYKDNMFLVPIDENTTYLAKPMNCPNAMIVYNLKVRSYRDLPLRLADCDVLHRQERSGALHGLLRVQKFQQDDAHIFLRPDQIEEEFARILDLADHFYRIFNLKYTYRLGTRPADFMGDPESWDKAEAALVRILDTAAGSGNYLIAEGDGAFYGPKIDILMEDILGRQWQMGTLQLDFQIPRRFDCTYTDAQGHEQTPVVIHRVIYGSLERFIGILIEHTAGAFPVWLAPEEARVISISEKHVDYGAAVRDALREAGLRVELEDSDKRMQAKIRQAELDKVPYIVVVGDREKMDGTVSVRQRSGKSLGTMRVAELATVVTKAVDDKV